MKSIKEKAFAKINLGLRVLGPYPGGYHEIDTIMVKIGLHDRAEIEPAAEMAVSCSPDIGIEQYDNIAFKAAVAAMNFTGNNIDKFHIRILKRIPLGAGLGGGSSDAAAVIRAIIKYYNIKPAESELLELGASIGSDVPFFLFSDTAQAAGRGEILKIAEVVLPFWILIVYPGIKISTKWAYGALPKPFANVPQGSIYGIVRKGLGDIDYLRGNLVNDFEKPVFSKYPGIKEIKDMLYELGAEFAQMSGSGSSVFGFFSERSIAEKAEKEFARFTTFICRQAQNTE